MHESTPTRSGGPSVSPPESSGRPAPASGRARGVDVVMSYIALTKPRVIELLLVAAIPALLQADRGEVHLSLVLLTLVGGWLGAASANTLNMVVDADIDKVMKRTERRPLARHAVSTRAALIFGLVLGRRRCCGSALRPTGGAPRLSSLSPSASTCSSTR